MQINVYSMKVKLTATNNYSNDYNRKSTALYPGPLFLSSDTLPSMPK